MGEKLTALQLLNVMDCHFTLNELPSTCEQLKHVSRVLFT